jgi:hypothetical protein
VSACPSCGKALPDSAERCDLCELCRCSLCSGAMGEGGTDFEPAGSVKAPRPFGITLLAIFCYIISAGQLLRLVALLVRPKVGSAISWEHATILLGSSVLYFALGLAFWRLHSLGPRVVVAVCLWCLTMDVMFGTPYFWDLVFSIILIWYLVTPKVRAAFHLARKAESPAYFRPTSNRLGIYT